MGLWLTCGRFAGGQEPRVFHRRRGAEDRKYTEAFRVSKMDQFPTRHNALLAHVVRDCGSKYFSLEGTRPHWHRQARFDRLELLKNEPMIARIVCHSILLRYETYSDSHELIKDG
eukprot:9096026-Pyramimonas_sp.AAC.1